MKIDWEDVKDGAVGIFGIAAMAAAAGALIGILFGCMELTLRLFEIVW